MKKVRKFLCIFLAACMLGSSAAAVEPEMTEEPTASAAETEEQDFTLPTEDAAEPPAAETPAENLPETETEEPEKSNQQLAAEHLYALGIWKGTGTDENGQPVFALEQPLTRIEVMVMLIRLLGEENQVSAYKSDYMQFQDTGTWERPYIGYAYAQGLTQGISGIRFGTKQLADGKQCLTFLLRALGYRDDLGDFSYEQALRFGQDLGVVTSEQIEMWQTKGFTRGDLAQLCDNILQMPVKNSTVTLEQILTGTFEGENLSALTCKISGSTTVSYGKPMEMIVTVGGLTQPATVSYAWKLGNATIRSGSIEIENGFQFVYREPAAFLAYETSQAKTLSLVLQGEDIQKTLRRQCWCENQSVNTHIQNLTLPANVSIPNGKRIVYGKSGAGRELVAYEFGSGDKVLFLNFAIHGFEDHWAHDGYALVLVAEKLMKSLSENIDRLNRDHWRVVVVPCANPDGLVDGWSNNGPGRCTIYHYLKETLVSGGIDLNRSFSRSFTVNTNSRNYTSAVSMAAPEAQALGTLIRQKKSQTTSIFLDVHGWTQQIITSQKNSVLTQVLQKAFPANRWSSVIGAHGYVANYAYGEGYQSGLFEFPSNVTSHSAMTSRGYDTRFVEAMWNLLSKA